MKYKVGDRVKIVSKWRNPNGLQNWNSKMDKWLGKIMTISRIDYGTYSMKEDNCKWCWYDSMIEGLANDLKIVITTDGKTTTARMYEGKKVIKTAESKCHPDDEFDFSVGANLAYQRLMDVVVCAPCDLEEPKKDKPEPVKLYCVKDDEPGVWLTKGKIYTVNADNKITFDDGYCDNYSGAGIAGFEGFIKRNPNWKNNLVPLVKRPAKVGEWVYANSTNDDLYHEGEVAQVVQTDADETVMISGNKEWPHGRWISDRHYLVLDGYQPEPDYYSGKVVCVEADDDSFTVGKIYEFVDGVVKDDEGDDRPLYYEPTKSLEEWNKYRGHIAKFIPLVE